MIWLAIFYLLNRDKGASSSGARPVPVLTHGASSGKLWLVRDNGNGAFDVATDSDAPVCAFVDAGGVRSLRSHPAAVDQKILGAAILDFKLRVPAQKEAA